MTSLLRPQLRCHLEAQLSSTAAFPQQSWARPPTRGVRMGWVCAASADESSSGRDYITPEDEVKLRVLQDRFANFDMDG